MKSHRSLMPAPKKKLSPIDSPPSLPPPDTIMPVALHKVQKHISKKRGGADALHEFSRDARRLRRAGHRVERLSRHASMTMKARQPYCECQQIITHKENSLTFFIADRIEFFHDAVDSIDAPLADADLAELVTK